MQPVRAVPDPLAYAPQKISSQLSVRVAISAKQKAEGIRRVWERIAKAKGENLDDEGKEVSMDPSHVARTLFERVVDEETASLTGGQGFPPLDDEKAWKALLDAVEAGVHKSQKSR